jgi:thymidylate synthase (FAD)
MGDDLSVVNSARVSFGKNKEELEKEDIKLINYLAKHRHFTPFEHCTLSVLIKCPLFIRSQIHRHRTFSYNEISRRYTSENLELYIPETFRKQHKSSKQCSDGEFSNLENIDLATDMENFHENTLVYYNDLLDMGVAREIARGVLPQNLMTEFWMTGNLRNWIHFLGLRIDSHAQKEVQDVARPILKIIKEKFPDSARALFQHQLSIDIDEL